MTENVLKSMSSFKNAPLEEIMKQETKREKSNSMSDTNNKEKSSDTFVNFLSKKLNTYPVEEQDDSMSDIDVNKLMEHKFFQKMVKKCEDSLSAICEGSDEFLPKASPKGDDLPSFGGNSRLEAKDLRSSGQM